MTTSSPAAAIAKLLAALSPLRTVEIRPFMLPPYRPEFFLRLKLVFASAPRIGRYEACGFRSQSLGRNKVRLGRGFPRLSQEYRPGKNRSQMVLRNWEMRSWRNIAITLIFPRSGLSP